MEQSLEDATKCVCVQKVCVLPLHDCTRSAKDVCWPTNSAGNSVLAYLAYASDICLFLPTHKILIEENFATW